MQDGVLGLDAVGCGGEDGLHLDLAVDDLRWPSFGLPAGRVLRRVGDQLGVSHPVDASDQPEQGIGVGLVADDAHRDSRAGRVVRRQDVLPLDRVDLAW